MRQKRFPLYFLLIAALVTFVACAPTAPPTPQVAFSSHADGATITGSRTVVLELDLTDALPTADIAVSTNATSVTETRTGDVLQLTVTLKDHANFVTVTVTNPGQALAGTATINLDYPFLTLDTAQAASVVIGQPDFDSNTETAADKYFDAPYVRPLVVGGVLYLPDYGADRVMGYLQVPTANGAAADFVLGKQDFLDADSTIDAATFDGPQTLESDGERLYVLNYSASRILVYSSLPTTSGAAADHVIGQPDFVTGDWGTSSTRLSYPESFTIAGGRLIVVDTDNSRVLIWNSVPTEIDTPADLVLGQADMNSGGSNGGGAAAANTLYYPSDAWSDGTRLAVTDHSNHRVLIWNAFPTADNQPADVVLGQPDFLTTANGLGASSLYYPYSVFSNGNQLFVADSDNNRVLVWNSFPTSNGQAADLVLGQVDFESDANALGASGLWFPTGVYVHGNSLFVTDNDNNRYLVFEGTDP
ncbi:MAG: hypothetical protein WDA03_05645 [Trueperaceae bacterium]